MSAPFRVVLHEPEIPNNTGNIGRTCVALGAGLDLIQPYGFSLDEKAVRRAGLDYWPRLDVREHADWDAYTAREPGARRWLLTTRAARPIFDADLQPGDHFVFGKETAGLPGAILDAAPAEARLVLPMAMGERSLNVATAVCAVLYEAVRQFVARGEASVGTNGRIVFA